jgi:hypothetical protein
MKSLIEQGKLLSLSVGTQVGNSSRVFLQTNELSNQVH